MRSMFLLPVLMFSSLAVAQPRQAKLTEIEVDPKLLTGEVLQATVSVDKAAREAQLTLLVDTCPKGAMCVAGPLPRIIKLPIVRTEVDGCESEIIVAKKDQRPADGDLQELEIRDNSENICETAPLRAMTEVIYQTESAGFGGPIVKTLSVFGGEELR